jgi:Rod binding domain-containing protein
MNAGFAIPAAFDAGLATADLATAASASTRLAKVDPARPENTEAKEKFQEILGELLFGQLLKSMRRTVDKPAYFHGGRAEEVFTQQLDQVLAQKMSQSAGDQFLGPMYELWSTGRR